MRERLTETLGRVGSGSGSAGTRSERVSVALGRPVDPRPLALARIGIGIAAAMIGFETLELLNELARPEFLRLPAFGWLPELGDGLIWSVFAASTLSAAALIAGFRARLAAAAVSVLAVVVMLLDEQAYSNHLALMAVLSALLALGQPAAAWSVDRRRHGKVPGTIPYWSVFLIKLQVSILYGFAALSKLNPSFLSGEVLDARARGLVSGLPDPVLAVASASAVAVELFLSFALWGSRLRRIAFPLALGFHLLIVVIFQSPFPLAAFALLALSTYPLFLDAEPASRLLVWDERCAFCERWASLLRGLDGFGVNRFIGSRDPRAFAGTGVTPAEAEHALQLVDSDERAEGYDAVRKVLEVSPATFLVAPLLGAWPLARLGRRAYRDAVTRGACGRQRVATASR